ncbi:MAG TPA: hypothetical protein VK694_05725 [Verrucomicrobiae bacterium]|nr:hypothetical protein [Verrucomicrobiae bacterium]
MPQLPLSEPAPQGPDYDLRLFGELAACFDVRLTETEIVDYGITLATMGVLDDILDEPIDGTVARANHQAHLNAIANNTPEALTHNPHNILGTYAVRFAEWSPDRQYHHMHHFSAIGDIALQKRETDNVQELFALLKEEGRRYASVFMPDQKGRDTHAFDTFLDSGGICAVLADTAWDLKGDYQQGLVQVKPTTANRAYFLGRMVPFARHVLESATPQQSKQLGQLLRGAVLGASSRVSVSKVGSTG